MGDAEKFNPTWEDPLYPVARVSSVEAERTGTSPRDSRQPDKSYTKPVHV